MIEVLETISATDDDGNEYEVDSVMTWQEPNSFALCKVLIMPVLAKDGLKFCGHAECLSAALQSGNARYHEMSLN